LFLNRCDTVAPSGLASITVPLPVDPAWKADYAGSVKRLIRDGVDLPLAHLFVQVSTLISNEAEGVERARSASERFLFRL
jgi:hypothetical protein